MEQVDTSVSRSAQLEALRRTVQESSSAPSELMIGTLSIELSPWIRHQLQQWSRGAQDRLHYLIAEGVATRMTLLAHVQQLEVADFEGSAIPQEASAQIEGDMEDSRRLVIELQRAANELFAASRQHDSRQLQGQVDGLRENLDRLQRKVQPSEAGAEQAPAGSDDGSAAAEGATGKRNHIRILLAVLLLLALVRGGMLLLGGRSEPFPRLGASDFDDLAGIEEVVARPPSLYVTVGTQWSALDPADRSATVEAVGERLRAAGYRGALFRDRAGRTTARWLPDRGAELVE